MIVQYRYPVVVPILGLILGLSFGSQAPAAPIHDAVSSGDINQVQALIGPELAINEKDIGDMTAIQLAISVENPDIAKLLINAGADVNIGSTRLKFTPLQIAARRGNAELVNLLIDNGAVVNLPNHEGTSALHYAVRAGENEIVELLIANGAEVNIKDFEDYTPLHNAAWNGHLETVELLVSNGADINLASYDGRTAYRCAIAGKNPEIADFLEKLGAVH